MAIDREENHDVAVANPTIVKGLLDIIAGYAKTEVSVQEAGRLRVSCAFLPHTFVFYVRGSDFCSHSFPQPASTIKISERNAFAERVLRTPLRWITAEQYKYCEKLFNIRKRYG